MIQIIKNFVPDDYQNNGKLMLYYLRTLKDKTYKKSIPSVSMYEVELCKNKDGIVLVIHQNYNSTSHGYTWSKIKDAIERDFAPTPENTPFQFLMDLRF